MPEALTQSAGGVLTQSPQGNALDTASAGGLYFSQVDLGSANNYLAGATIDDSLYRAGGTMTFNRIPEDLSNPIKPAELFGNYIRFSIDTPDPQDGQVHIEITPTILDHFHSPGVFTQYFFQVNAQIEAIAGAISSSNFIFSVRGPYDLSLGFATDTASTFIQNPLLLEDPNWNTDNWLTRTPLTPVNPSLNPTYSVVSSKTIPIVPLYESDMIKTEATTPIAMPSKANDAIAVLVVRASANFSGGIFDAQYLHNLGQFISPVGVVLAEYRNRAAFFGLGFAGRTHGTATSNITTGSTAYGSDSASAALTNIDLDAIPSSGFLFSPDGGTRPIAPFFGGTSFIVKGIPVENYWSVGQKIYLR